MHLESSSLSFVEGVAPFSSAASQDLTRLCEWKIMQGLTLELSRESVRPVAMRIQTYPNPKTSKYVHKSS